MPIEAKISSQHACHVAPTISGSLRPNLSTMYSPGNVVTTAMKYVSALSSTKVHKSRTIHCTQNKLYEDWILDTRRLEDICSVLDGSRQLDCSTSEHAQ